MKKKLLLILVLITVLTGGCSKITGKSSLIKGQEKLENHKYGEALTLLSQALNEDSENESARAMYMQARRMQNAENYEKKHDYEKAIKELDSIVNINAGSKQIKRESINKKAELEKLQKTAEKEALERKENAKKASEKDINKLESEMIYNNKKKEEEKKKQETEESNKEELRKDPIKEETEDKKDNSQTNTDPQLKDTSDNK
ncbi:tetratricopeptide repeat protein [Terrisporobacter glycolicus]|uniref:Tetratricopeptide repeat protein n=1 Tax=Terrisporobacter glycolicus ATCC 14880 = DSM 1288 TaxID=1121315 RepID=A0ABZ2EUG5_9FIRM|nr:tetratricopeptide repeat protein [Terrisporobacter glycolicus]